jgi:hypothetical protein
MAKLRGTIKKSDLEGGVFQLHTADGDVYELEGDATVPDPLLTTDGAKVEVDGAVDRNAMSFTMSGPRFKVKSIKRV